MHLSSLPIEGRYLEVDRPRFEPMTFWVASKRSTITKKK